MSFSKALAHELGPLGIRPEDIADLVLFLASERAAHITGQLVSVSGGSWMP